MNFIKHRIGDMVYLKTDQEQLERLVIGINIRPHNTAIYLLCLGSIETFHYDIEITTDKNVLGTIL